MLQLKLGGCRSLKEKRSTIKPLLKRLHREFNVSSVEIEKNDLWDESVVACGLISNDKGAAHAQLTSIVSFLETYWRKIDILDYSITFL